MCLLNVVIIIRLSVAKHTLPLFSLCHFHTGRFRFSDFSLVLIQTHNLILSVARRLPLVSLLPAVGSQHGRELALVSEPEPAARSRLTLAAQFPSLRTQALSKPGILIQMKRLFGHDIARLFFKSITTFIIFFPVAMSLSDITKGIFPEMSLIFQK